jgi:hypothetical protein
MSLIDEAFKEYVLDHFEHFQCFPLEFEYCTTVYDMTWVWDKLEELNLFCLVETT